MDKDINTFCMRLKEWFAWHFPELTKLVNDNAIYAKLVHLFQATRENVTDEFHAEIAAVTMDEERATQIIEAAKISMGMDMNESDSLQVQKWAERVVELINFRESLINYLRDRMNAVAPNLNALIGEIVGSKLIAHAGGLTNLSKYPASTIQILGAEKALFRALKTKGKTPKYGLIFNSTFIGRAGLKNKGKISRYLANKCAIASRVDCFSVDPTSKFGESLKDQCEERLKFLASGQKPRKNKDAMDEVIKELKNDGLFYGDKVRMVKEVHSDDSDADMEEAPKKKSKKPVSNDSESEEEVVEKKRDKKNKDKKDKKDKKSKKAAKESSEEESDSEVEKSKKKDKKRQKK
jgi:nucleolar protein 56